MMIHSSVQGSAALSNRMLSLRDALQVAGHALRRAVLAADRFIADVINAQAEARVRDQRYGHAAW